MNYSSRIKVEIWSDFVCSFCYMGKRSFEQALKNFEHRDKVDVVYRSFQLDPNQKKSSSNQSIYEMVAQKKGVSIEKAKQMISGVAQLAKTAGLEFNFDTVILAGTYDAHRLAHYAKSQNKLDEFVEQTMYAFFTNSQDIGDTETLVQLAVKAGLDEQQSREVLTQGKYSEEVKRDRKEAEDLGVYGVPHFRFDEKYEVSGAQQPDVFVGVLNQMWNDQNNVAGSGASQKKSDATEDGCKDGSCKI